MQFPKQGLDKVGIFEMKSVLRIFFIVTILLGLHTGAHAQQKSRIRFEGAKSMKNLNINGQKIIRYIGNVRFRHENTRIVCDSAYQNPDDNWFDAFGNVSIQQGSTRITGQTLHFDGKTSVGKITGKEVKLIDEETTLTTQTLFFNSKTNVAYYTTPGVITSKESKLSSQRGYFNRFSNLLSFAGNVVMVDPNGTIYTDSLSYNTQNELAYFFGPTHIFNEDNYAYCEKGWYNKKIEQTNLQQNAYILSQENKIFGNNIFYDKSIKFAHAIGNVVLVDTLNRAYIYGQKANFWQETEQAEVTENPYLMLIDNSDSLFLKANYFKVITQKHENSTDSSYRVLKALGNVAFYRHDVQGFCDSMIYNTRDSAIDMYVDPILWNDVNQMTADHITIHSKNNKINQMDFNGNAFITSFEQDKFYNQIKGKTITAFFSNGKAEKIDVNGNGQAVYFIRDGNTLTLANRSESARISIMVKDNKASRVTFHEKPSSNLYPIEKVELEDVMLKGFKWLEAKRPANRYSVIPKDFKEQPEERGNKKQREILSSKNK